MASVIKIKKGIALSVYDDRFRPIYSALGLSVEITRASDVEHNGVEWIALERGSGRVIAHGPERNQVITDEVTYLEGKLS